MNDQGPASTPTPDGLDGLDFERLPELLMSPYLQIEVVDAMTQNGPVRKVKVQVAHDGKLKGGQAVLMREMIQDMDASEGDIMNRLLAAVCYELNKAITPTSEGLIVTPDSSLIVL
jgi:hypothetical protein